MKKIFFFAVLIFTAQSVFALDSRRFTANPREGLSFYVSPEMGVMNGYMREYVYDIPKGGTKKSELDWDLESIYYYGLSGGVQYNNFQFSIFAGKGFERNSSVGYMQDYDWLSDGDYYSIHSCYHKDSLFLDIAGGYAFYPVKRLSIIPSVGYQIIDITAEGYDGHGVYPWGTQSFTGKVIKYSQRYLIPYGAVETVFDVSDRMSLSARIAVSKFLVCIAVDNHYTTGYEFHDFVRYGYYFSYDIKALFHFTERISFFVDQGLEYVPDRKGWEYEIETSTGNRNNCPDGSIGVGFKAWRISAGPVLTF